METTHSMVKLHTVLKKLHTAPWKLFRVPWKLHTAVCKTSRRRFVSLLVCFLSIFIKFVSCCEKSQKNIHIFYYSRPSPERQRARRQTLVAFFGLRVRGRPPPIPALCREILLLPRSSRLLRQNEWSDKFEHKR